MEDINEAVKEQFNKDSTEYLSKHLRPENQRETLRILNLAKESGRFGRVLDMGCGPGTISENLLEISDFVCGLDLSEDMVRIATEKFRGTLYEDRLSFISGNAMTMKYPDAYFDAVFCIGVLRYLPSLDNGLKEIYRVLKPGGIVVSTFYYMYSPFWFSSVFIYRPLLPLISLIKGRSIKTCMKMYKAEPLPFSYARFKNVFEKTGFSIVGLQHSGFELFPFNRVFPRISRFMYLKLESLFFDSGFFGWVGSICIVKGKKG